MELLLSRRRKRIFTEPNIQHEIALRRRYYINECLNRKRRNLLANKLVENCNVLNANTQTKEYQMGALFEYV